MSKRPAAEAFNEPLTADSPASKKSRFDEPEDFPNGLGANGHGADKRRARDEEDMVDEDEDEDEEDEEQQRPARRQQAVPVEGYDDLYLDTIDRSVLDFDFEKLCSVTLSNINVYACLVCGRYFQGRGPGTQAYLHSVGEEHHVFINMETQKVYVLPDGYEAKSRSLDDIKYVSDPRYTRAEVAELDRKPRTSWTLDGKDYTPGFVGMNNIKENDYLNVVVQALSHVQPLRNYFLLEDFPASGGYSELVRRTATLFRKMWNPRAFKAHVSPHELLQAVALQSGRRFTLTAQADPAEFLSWFLNNLHLGLGGSKTKPGSSMVQRVFQGRLRVESQAITARVSALDDDADRPLRFEESGDVKVDVSRFMMLTLDLPPAPLFQDDVEGGSIIPQVALTSILSKYDGVRTQEGGDVRRRYRLLHPLPPYLALHVKRFSQNKWVAERNPTIVTFDARGLDLSPYVEPQPGLDADSRGPVWYDLVANVVHETVRAKEDVADSGEERKTWKVQLRNRAAADEGDGSGEWLAAQDLFVDKTPRGLLYLGESYLQIWERRRTPGQAQAGKGKGKA